MNYFKLFKNKTFLKLLKNFLSLSSLNVLQFLISLFIVPYLIRTIGLEKLGTINFVLSLVAYFIPLVDYGFIVQATREVALVRDDKLKLNHTFSKYFISSLYNFILVSLAYIIIIFIIQKFRQDVFLYVLAYFTVLGKLLLCEWYYQGTERMEFIAILNAISKLLYVVVLIVFIHNQNDYSFVLLFQGLNALIVGIISILIIVFSHRIKMRVVTIKEYINTLKSGFALFANQFLPNLYNNSTTFILGLYSSDFAVGLLSTAKFVSEISNMVISMLSRTFFPFLNRNFEKHYIYRNIVLVVSISMCILMFLFAGIISNLLVHNSVSEVTLLIRILTFGTLGFGLMSIYGNNFLIIKKQDKLVMKITFYISILGFITSFIFVSLFNVNGAAINLSFTRIAYGIVFLFFYWKMSNNISSKIKFKNT